MELWILFWGNDRGVFRQVENCRGEREDGTDGTEGTNGVAGDGRWFVGGRVGRGESAPTYVGGYVMVAATCGNPGTAW